MSALGIKACKTLDDWAEKRWWWQLLSQRPTLSWTPCFAKSYSSRARDAFLCGRWRLKRFLSICLSLQLPMWVMSPWKELALLFVENTEYKAVDFITRGEVRVYMQRCLPPDTADATVSACSAFLFTDWPINGLSFKSQLTCHLCSSTFSLFWNNYPFIWVFLALYQKLNYSTYHTVSFFFLKCFSLPCSFEYLKGRGWDHI